MIDLTTTYLGLNLANPLVPSASPLTEELDNIRRMEDAGAPAVVLHSLFEEQITLESHELDRFLGAGTESFPESLTYLPDLTGYNRGPDGYLEHLLPAGIIAGHQPARLGQRANPPGQAVLVFVPVGHLTAAPGRLVYLARESCLAQRLFEPLPPQSRPFDHAVAAE